MVQRRAIGATLAAILIFSSLLLTNLALFESGEQDASLAALRYQEARVEANIIVSESLVAVRFLDDVQSALSSGPLPCGSASSSITGEFSGLTLTDSGSGAVVVARISPGPDLTRYDNLTTLHPFEGSVYGWLNFGVSIHAIDSSPGARVTYDKEEAHFFHIPANVSGSSAYCLSVADNVSSELAAMGSQLCNLSAVDEEMAALQDELAPAAVQRGLGLALYYQFGTPTACSVSFTVELTQSGVGGPLGPFNWTARQGGSASFASQPAPQSA